MASWRRQRCRRRLRCHLLFTSAAVGKWSSHPATPHRQYHTPPPPKATKILPSHPLPLWLLLSSSWQLHCLQCTSPVVEAGKASAVHCACPCLHYVHASKTSRLALVFVAVCVCVPVCVWGCRKAKSLQLQLNLLLLGRAACTPATRCCCMLLLQLNAVTRRQDTKNFGRKCRAQSRRKTSAIFRPTELRNSKGDISS